jgi:hypothetical protein
MDIGSRPRLPFFVAVATMAVLALGCGGGARPAATGAAAEVTSAASAAAAVQARSPLFDGIGFRDPQAVGASSWWTAVPADGATPPAWTVTYDIGWGDCPAGCTDAHTWTYFVEPDGGVTFQEETGSPVPDDVFVDRVSRASGAGVGGRVGAGPVCPVERPGDTACAPRPVAGATLTVRSGDSTVGTFATDTSGLYRIALPPGDYVLDASPVDGLMGTPPPMPFTVTGTGLTPLDVAYDTGIR